MAITYIMTVTPHCHTVNTCLIFSLDISPKRNSLEEEIEEVSDLQLQTLSNCRWQNFGMWWMITNEMNELISSNREISSANEEEEEKEEPPVSLEGPIILKQETWKKEIQTTNF